MVEMDVNDIRRNIAEFTDENLALRNISGDWRDTIHEIVREDEIRDRYPDVDTMHEIMDEALKAHDSETVADIVMLARYIPVPIAWHMLPAIINDANSYRILRDHLRALDYQEEGELYELDQKFMPTEEFLRWPLNGWGSHTDMAIFLGRDDVVREALKNAGGILTISFESVDVSIRLTPFILLMIRAGLIAIGDDPDVSNIISDLPVRITDATDGTLWGLAASYMYTLYDPMVSWDVNKDVMMKEYRGNVISRAYVQGTPGKGIIMREILSDIDVATQIVYHPYLDATPRVRNEALDLIAELHPDSLLVPVVAYGVAYGYLYLLEKYATQDNIGQIMHVLNSLRSSEKNEQLFLRPVRGQVHALASAMGLSINM